MDPNRDLVQVAVLKPAAGREDECLARCGEVALHLRRHAWGRVDIYRDPTTGSITMMIWWWSHDRASAAHLDATFQTQWRGLHAVAQVVVDEPVLERIVV